MKHGIPSDNAPSGLSSQKPYFFYADVMRTAGIIMIIFIHVSSRIIEMYGRIDYLEWWLANIVNSSARWSIPAFVMLSGALLLSPDKHIDNVQFFRKRFKRIGMPFVFWTVIYFFWLNKWYDVPITPGLILRKVVFGGPYYHLYFLYVISLMYIFTPLIRKILKRHNITLTVLLISLFLIVGLINSFLFYRDFSPGQNFFEENHGVFFFVFLLSFAGYFMVGYLLKMSKTNNRLIKLRLFILILSITATSFLTSIQFHKSGLYHFGQFFYDYFSPTTILSSLLIFSLIKDIFRMMPDSINYVFKYAVRTSSSASFGIYLSHLIFLDLLNRMIGITGTDVTGRFLNLPPMIYISVATTTTFSAGLLLTLTMYKIPFLRPFSGYSK